MLAPPLLTPPADNFFPLRKAFDLGFFVSESTVPCEFLTLSDLIIDMHTFLNSLFAL